MLLALMNGHRSHQKSKTAQCQKRLVVKSDKGCPHCVCGPLHKRSNCLNRRSRRTKDTFHLSRALWLAQKEIAGMALQGSHGEGMHPITELNERLLKSE